MDLLLTQTLVHKNEYAEVLPFDYLLPRCEEKMKPAYRLSFPGKEPEIKKGQVQPVILDISQRGANKKVSGIFIIFIDHVYVIYFLYIDIIAFDSLSLQNYCSTFKDEESISH